MISRRVLRRWFSGWLMLAMLFTQIATAAYACPALVAASSAADTSMAGMPCAEAMQGGSAAVMPLDAEEPGLCLQHCQFGKTQQPADAAPPGVPAVAALLLFTLNPLDQSAAAPAAWSRHVRHRERVPPPPHSIAHCCWRL